VSVDGVEARPRVRRLLGRIVIDTRPLRVRDYRRLWGSSAIIGIGGQFTTVAVPKQVYDLTGSSGYVGLTGAVGFVVLVVFGLWGGAISDAVDRRKLVIVTGLGVAATSGMLWAQAFTGLHSVWVVLALMGVQQAFIAINLPTRNAMIPRLVPPELLAPANALGFTVYMMAAVFGPLAAGALIPVLGLSTLYLIDTVALVIAVLLTLGLPAMPPIGGTTRTAGLRDIGSGFRYLSTQKILLASFLVDIIAMVAGMPRALFPEMAERTFGDPPGGGPALGWLYAAMPLGAAGLGLLSGWISRMSRKGVVVSAAVVVWGASMVGFGLSHAILVAAVFLAIGGAADLVSAIHRGTILQEAATDEMRGRIQGAFIIVVTGGPRIADLVHGWAATALGTSVASWAGGLLVIFLTIAAILVIPAFWRYRS
jgi:MFS family permease